jgi:signal transduction histidine kinase/ActR/RegA family two-component response regulator
MASKREYSLRQYLMAFGAALLVPILGLAAISMWEFARAEKQQNEQRAQAAAEQMIADIDQELARLQAAGQALASSAALRAGNYERFQQRATEVTRALPRADYQIVVRDLTGQQVVNTHVPWGTPLPRGAAPETDRQVTETKKPYVSDLFTGATAGRGILTVRIPVLADETVTHVLSVAFEPAHLTKLLRAHKLPPAWTPTVLDRNNRVIASLKPDRLVGTTVSQVSGVPGDGLWWGINEKGDPVLRVFANSDQSGWRAFIEVPNYVIQAPLWRTFWLFGLLVTALLVISLTIALWFGHRIARPFQQLAEGARALGQQDMSLVPLASGVKEADQVSRAMAAAYTELTHREAALAASFREVAERDRQAVELRAAKEVAEQASKAKSDFLAVMSHELRTPLTGVLGMADLLAAKSLNDEERYLVEEIRSSGRHLRDLISDVLDLSRIESGKLELEHTSFSISELLEAVRSLMTPQAIERGLDLTLELDESLPPILKGDPTHLRQVLINFVGNGLKFTNRGGVRISASHRQEQDGRIRLRFEVRDTGIGIPKDKQAELFKPFVQADRSITRQYGGSGLGLAISKRLVEAMGGTLGVDSLPGVGSRFWFEVVLETGDAAAAEPAKLDPATVPPRRILLVEDVELNRRLLQMMLSAHGHEVIFATSGAEAVELVVRERFDVVLMDVQMPVMDGVEATRQIRQMAGPAREVPIIGLTANVLASEQQRYLAAGMNACLTKPIDWDQLFAALARSGGGSETEHVAQNL